MSFGTKIGGINYEEDSSSINDSLCFDFIGSKSSFLDKAGVFICSGELFADRCPLWNRLYDDLSVIDGSVTIA